MKLVKAGHVSAGADASHEVVDQMMEDLRSLQAMHTAAGLEDRILARLEMQRACSSVSRGRHGWTALFPAGVRGWAPAAMAASLLCVFGGGIFVARQTAVVVQTAPPMRVQRSTGSSSLEMGVLASTPGSLPAAVAAPAAPAPASAQRRPAYAVPAGHHRGRSAEARVAQRNHP